MTKIRTHLTMPSHSPCTLSTTRVPTCVIRYTTHDSLACLLPCLPPPLVLYQAKSTTEEVPYPPRSYLTTVRPPSRSSPTHTTDMSRLHASAPSPSPTCSLDESHPVLVGSAAKPPYLFKFTSCFHSSTTSSLLISRLPRMSSLHPMYIRPIPHPIISRRISLR